MIFFPIFLDLEHLSPKPNKFGRKGEGPGDFSSDLIITILKEKIMIESQGKLSFYSFEGDLIKEIPLLPHYRKLKLKETREK